MTNERWSSRLYRIAKSKISNGTRARNESEENNEKKSVDPENNEWSKWETTKVKMSKGYQANESTEWHTQKKRSEFIIKR